MGLCLEVGRYQYKRVVPWVHRDDPMSIVRSAAGTSSAPDLDFPSHGGPARGSRQGKATRPRRSFLCIPPSHTDFSTRPDPIFVTSTRSGCLGLPASPGSDHALDICHCMPVSGSQSVHLPSCPNRDLHVPGRASGLPQGRLASNPYRYRVFITRHKTVGCRQPASPPASEATHPVSPLRPARLRIGISPTAVGPTRTAPMVKMTEAFPHLRSIRPPSSSLCRPGSTSLPQALRSTTETTTRTPPAVAISTKPPPQNMNPTQRPSRHGHSQWRAR